MFSDGRSFLKKTTTFHNLLKEDLYPNAKTFAEAAGCSKRTAQRLIERFKDEFGMPIEYDAQRRGYVLKDKSFLLDTLPPGKDEFVILLFMRQLAEQLGDERIILSIDRLWEQSAKLDRVLKCELQELSTCFTADLSEVGVLSESGLLDYLYAAQRGETVEFNYKSAWRHTEPQNYIGKILRVGFVDGRLYLLIFDESGKERVLNASFIKKFTILNRDIDTSNLITTGSVADSWLYGFGVWMGEELVDIEVRIASPASEYFEKQIWDQTQEDEWDGDILIRRMKAMISPELVRRLLSLGKYLIDAKPEKLKEMVIADATAMLEGLKDPQSYS
jgi:predicted DNA-binding transcriptional regulator YafY